MSGRALARSLLAPTPARAHLPKRSFAANPECKCKRAACRATGLPKTLPAQKDTRGKSCGKTHSAEERNPESQFRRLRVLPARLHELRPADPENSAGHSQ